MVIQENSKRYEAILFDVGNTLLTKSPTDSNVFVERCKEAGIALDTETAKISWKQSEMWVTEQILSEMAGAPRMPDHEFFKRPDFVALRTAFNEKTDEEIWENGFTYPPIPRPKTILADNRRNSYNIGKADERGL